MPLVPRDQNAVPRRERRPFQAHGSRLALRIVQCESGQPGSEVLTAVTSDRRSEQRPQSPSRRRARRPALWLTLLVLALGLATLAVASEHRRRLDTKFERIVRTHVSSP